MVGLEAWWNNGKNLCSGLGTQDSRRSKSSRKAEEERIEYSSMKLHFCCLVVALAHVAVGKLLLLLRLTCILIT